MAKWLSAEEASALLGIKKETLYAYVSRGQVRTETGATPRERLYAASDLQRLKARRSARSGHGPAAASALRWGEPVMETGVSDVGDGRLAYRGLALDTLLARGVGFEAVAEHLWSGLLPETAPRWPRPSARFLAELEKHGAGALREDELPRQWFRRASHRIARLAEADEAAGTETTDQALVRARSAVLCLAMGVPAGGGAQVGVGVPAAHAAGASVAEILASRLAAGTAPELAATAIDRILVAIADHELNSSTFAARVAASTGADTYACLQAGLGALAGPRHGASFAAVEELFAALRTPADAKEAVLKAKAQKLSLPGFGHRLHAASGDPRARLLLADAVQLAKTAPKAARERFALAQALLDAVGAAKTELPNVDLAVVAVLALLGAPRGAASAVFSVGRIAGWVAHVIEQRYAEYQLRPRAKFVRSV